MLIFAVLFLVPLKQEPKNFKKYSERSIFRGGRHGLSVVNSSNTCVFRVFEQAPFLYNFWLHFGLNFGVSLGANFATILLFGRPGGQNRLTKERLKDNNKNG